MSPGDVVSYGTSDPGHVAVVVSSTLNSQGTGRYTVIQENTAGEVTLNVTKWRPAGEYDLEGHYMAVTGWLHVKPPPTTTVSPQHGFPVDPVCQTHKIAEPDTTITISGSYYKPHDKLFVRSAHVLLGTPVVSAAGGWSLRFTVPTRPDDAREPLTVVDASKNIVHGELPVRRLRLLGVVDERPHRDVGCGGLGCVFPDDVLHRWSAKGFLRCSIERVAAGTNVHL